MGEHGDGDGDERGRAAEQQVRAPTSACRDTPLVERSHSSHGEKRDARLEGDSSNSAAPVVGAALAAIGRSSPAVAGPSGAGAKDGSGERDGG
jgi:hypothetical protein